MLYNAASRSVVVTLRYPLLFTPGVNMRSGAPSRPIGVFAEDLGVDTLSTDDLWRT
jgi:hypothetical protein